MYCQFCSVYLFIYLFFVFMSYFVRNFFCNRVKKILKKKKKKVFFIQKIIIIIQNKTKKIFALPTPIFLNIFFFFFFFFRDDWSTPPRLYSLKMTLIFCGHSGEGCENSDGTLLGVDSPVQQPRPSHLQTRAAWCSQNLDKR